LPCTEEYFYKNDKNKKDGLNPECKKCSSKKSSDRQKANPEHYGKIKKDWHNKNAEKHTQQKKDWHQAHKEKRQEDCKRFHQLNPNKQFEYAQNHRDHDISDTEWEHCKDFFKNKNGEWCCAYCGMTENEHIKVRGERLHKDHTNHNGANDISNCTPACFDCNSRKWQYDMEEWYRKQSYFNESNLNNINLWNSKEYKKYIETKPPYRIKRSRIYKEDGTYSIQHELWTVDEYRNIIECIDITRYKKDLNLKLAFEYKKCL
jgi:hypothetical protein